MNKQRQQNTSNDAAGECGSACGCHAKDGYEKKLSKPTDRRSAIKQLGAGLLGGAALVQQACSVTSSQETREKAQLNWEEYFKGNYRLMNSQEKEDTVKRLELQQIIKSLPIVL